MSYFSRPCLFGALSLALILGAVMTPMAQERDTATGMEFIKIPPGEFMMGCSEGDRECTEAEKPVHRVQITKGFEITKYEVTQAQWESVMGSNPSHFKGADRPVEQVSWRMVQPFFEKLNSRQDGYRYRLPTEAEWEYAARAGTTDRYGGSIEDVAWYIGNSGEQTHPVGQKQPNAWGLYDTLGNVWEWVEDWFEFYSGGPQTDPSGPTSGEDRIMRGGSWGELAINSRVSHRDFWAPTDKNPSVGFRCVRQPIR